MKKFIILFAIPMLFICGVASENKNLVKNTNNFALELYKQLAVEKINANLVLSPFSISQTLGMTYDGSKKETRTQMQNVLGFPQSEVEIGPVFSKVNRGLLQKSDTVSFTINNGLWAQKDYAFLPEYFTSVSKNYSAPVKHADYKSKEGRSSVSEEINNWVSSSTEGKIKELLKPSDLVVNTRLVLVNAIWFNAHWKQAFKKEDTKSAEFFNLDNSASKVAMMAQKGKFEYYENKTLQVISLPYKGDRFKMMVVLPANNDDFQKFERELNSDLVIDLQKQLLSNTIEISLPKFKMESDIKLKPVLQKMGMSLAFSDTADFSGMTGKKDLKIDKVIHKAFIDVSEEGTEAAAATAVTMVRKTAVVDIKRFVANKPFVYFILDSKTGIIVFTGRYVKGNS